MRISASEQVQLWRAVAEDGGGHIQDRSHPTDDDRGTLLLELGDDDTHQTFSQTLHQYPGQSGWRCGTADDARSIDGRDTLFGGIQHFLHCGF